MIHDHLAFALTDKQKEVRKTFTLGYRYFLVYGGSRSGKTFFICYAIIARALKAPGSRHVIFRSDGVDAKQSIGNETIPSIISLKWPGLGMRWNEKDGYFQLDNGSQIWLAGLKDKARLDKVLGKEFVTIYLNEASQITLEAFRVVLTRLAQVVYDVDGNVLEQKLYADLNPTTSAHWTHKIWIDGVNPEDGSAIDGHAEEYVYMRVNPTDNIQNLSPEYLKSLEKMPSAMRKRFFEGAYGGDDPDAIWQRKFIQRSDAPELQRIVVAVDPAVSTKAGSDETGIVVAGIVDKRCYVLADESGKMRPEDWARRAVSMYDMFDADCIVAEVNNGGDLVESAIKAAAKGRMIPYKAVHASRGKFIRAEPIASLYEQGKVFHVSEYPQLEDQMCSFTVDFDRKEQGYSPDRMDALVWALTELFPGVVQRSKVKPPATPIPTRMPMAHRR